ncbi:hypothetical protein [Bartonella sp. CB60]|uniref:hypothetical protein n=1 Tax=Bartonella sp. CB60 TaxID=3113619 RepID=UPI00300DCE0F
MNKNSHYGMKRGLILSLGVHTTLLSLGAMHFTDSVSLQQQQLEAIPIIFAPLDQEFSSQQGTLDAPVQAISAVKPTNKPQEKEEAHHFGDGQVDSIAPFMPKEKPRNVETTPLSSGEERATEEPLVSPEVAEAVVPDEPAESVSEVAEAVVPDEPAEPVSEVTESVVSDEPAESAPEVAEAVVPDEPAESAPEVAEAVVPDEPAESAPEVAEAVVPDEPTESAPEVTESVVPDEPAESVSEVTESVVSDEPAESAPEVTEAVVPDEPAEFAPEVAEAVAPDEPAEFVPEVIESVVPKASPKTLKNEEVILPQNSAPMIQKKPVEQTPEHQQAPQKMLSEKLPLPQVKPKPDKHFTNQNAQTAKKQNQQTAEQTIEHVLAMEEKHLLNHARTQGGGAKRSSKPEAFGGQKNTKDATKIAQTLVSITGACIQRKLKLVALGGDFRNRPVVRLRFSLNYDGMVVGDPIIDPLSGDESQKAIMTRQVYAAVFSCQPYADLPRDQYDLWKQGFDFNVDPFQEISR